MDFDETRLYYSHQRLQRQDAPQDGEGENNNNNNADAQDDQVELKAVRRHFREFLRKSNTIVCCVDYHESKRKRQQISHYLFNTLVTFLLTH